MDIHLPQAYFSRMMRAIVEFNLIENGDNILIGLSGGKDSVFLTYALAVFRQKLKKDFSLAAITVDPMFRDRFPADKLAAFCQSLEIPFHLQKVDIAATIQGQGEKDPCYTCAFFRRGAINRFAKENGYNKVAYAHHHDDAVETFLMSLFYSGQLRTFLPSTYLGRTNLTVIRPLVYFREAELRETTSLHGFTPIDNPCPFNGKTKRQEIKELIEKLGEGNPMLYAHLAAGMRENAVIELWPPQQNRVQLKDKYNAYMYGD